MITITIPAKTVEDAVEIRDKVHKITTDAHIGNGGVVIYTRSPLRMIKALVKKGIIVEP